MSITTLKTAQADHIILVAPETRGMIASDLSAMAGDGMKTPSDRAQLAKGLAIATKALRRQAARSGRTWDARFLHGRRLKVALAFLCRPNTNCSPPATFNLGVAG